MQVELIANTPNPQGVIAYCGKIAHKSHGTSKKTDGEFCRMLIKIGHESVLEHASATIEFNGVSRAMTHQLVRHRLCAFTQESQRYVKVDRLVWNSTTPEDIMDSAQATKDVYNRCLHDIQKAYRTLIKCGVRKEDARFVLPNACQSTIAVTANFREWRHIIKERTSKHAQWEIRNAIVEARELLCDIAPDCFEV